MHRRLAVVERVKTQLLEARSEENADGNPRAAAAKYIAATEYITLALHEVPFQSAEARALFFSQVFEQLQSYVARAELLLQIADDEDKAKEHAGRAPPDDSFDRLYAQFMANEQS